MHKVFLPIFLFFAVHCEAAIWVKLQDNGNARLMVDKQSILEKEKYKRAWVKVTYKTPQINLEVADKTYNQSKLLWFFDCPAQTAATAQVFQYLNEELTYSAAVDYKAARFIEPVPETDIDTAMRYVCEIGKPSAVAADKPAAKANPDAAKKTEGAVEKPAETPNPEAQPAAEKAEPTQPQAVPETNAKPPVKQDKKGSAQSPWAYQGKEGSANWGKLSPDYAACEAGRNQSPINVEQTIHAALKELKVLQKFPAKEMLNQDHTLAVRFKDGNMMVLDGAPFQMKQLQFRAPSEHTIKGKSYPLEAQFMHANSKSEQSMIAVLFEEGEANAALQHLLKQLPKEAGKLVPLKSRVLPSELMPQKRTYYRFSGSLTMPPCTEGVRWVLMKAPMTASKEQIEAFKQVLQGPNNRPVQPLNGRVVLESN